MTAPKLSRAAAKLLAAEEIELTAPSTKEREQTVAAIKAELSLRAQRGKRRRWARPLVGVAAAAVLVIGARTWSQRGAAPEIAGPVHARSVVAEMVRGAVFVEQSGERVALRATTPLMRGSTIVAMDGEALLLLPSGSKVDVEHATTVSLIEDGESELMVVDRGAVTSTVTKRGPGQRFVIRTPDAEVEVRGTVFRVSRLEDPRCGLQTRVHVDEGRVVVRAGQNGAMLERGGDWASPCVAAATAEVAVIPAGIPPGVHSGIHPGEAPVEGTSASREASRQPSRLAPSAGVTTPAAPPQGAHPSAPAAASELAAQNALFADAMSSKARGDT
ncbi:MAG: hypothetical protein JWO86_7964, partial [Myxococcaceae bacterium]|nr:hypothetical protein [Myxococcaceae bacterium]